MRRITILVAAAVLAGLAPTAAAGRDASSPLFEIPFSSGTIDPVRDLEPSDPAARDLVLVQFDRFGATETVHRLAATGARLVQPLAPVSYIVWADAAQTRAARGLPGVRWAGVLPSRVRVSGVSAGTTRLRVTTVGTGGLGDSGAHARAFTEVAGAVNTIRGGPGEARLLSLLPAVYSVTDAGRPALREERSSAIVAQGTKAALQPNYREFLQSIGADGTGVILSHVDGGADMNHPDLQGRIQACVAYKGHTAMCTAGNHDDAIGHGTHTLGIILGTGTTPFADLDGFDYGLGMAPGAKAVVQNAIHTGVGGNAFAQGYRKVYRDAHDLGAIVSANSWGPDGSPRGYDAKTREFDTIVRDIDENEPGDQPMGLVFSDMNGNGGTSTQGTPDEAKNILGITATGNRAGPGADDLCTCSAHGPALDGRILPMLVAPGQGVVSTRAAQGTLCGLVFASARETAPSPLHAGCTGTSMASPHVTGAYAVFVDWYRKSHGGATPSPALVKAAFVNGADDLKGGRDASGVTMTYIPNNKQGWGRLNLGNTMSAWRTGVVQIDQSVVFDDSDQSHEMLVEPLDPAKPMKVTLTWTDAPGPGLGGSVKALVNDLDLKVESLGETPKTWLGNRFQSGYSVTGGNADRRENLENVYLASPGMGPLKVRIAATNIIGDGMPNREGATDQDFALVISNARVVQP